MLCGSQQTLVLNLKFLRSVMDFLFASEAKEILTLKAGGMEKTCRACLECHWQTLTFGWIFNCRDTRTHEQSLWSRWSVSRTSPRPSLRGRQHFCWSEACNWVQSGNTDSFSKRAEQFRRPSTTECESVAILSQQKSKAVLPVEYHEFYNSLKKKYETGRDFSERKLAC